MRFLLLLALAACDLDLERMEDQPRFTSYEACDVCPQGTIMMLPPTDTVARGVEVDVLPADDATTIAIPVDRNVLARGRNRFDIFCAACHGRLADGNSQVAEDMKLRRPPNLLEMPLAEGHIFRVVTQGFGLMRSYANELPVRDRWAVVAYIKALQLSQRLPLDSLSPQQQQEARRWLAR